MSRRTAVASALALAGAAALGCGAMPASAQLDGFSGSFEYSPVSSNPLMGYCGMGKAISSVEGCTLVFLEPTWKEWEPEEGVFDIEGLEEKWRVMRWKAQGKHAVLRFICDLPGDEAHRDIPDWLYEKTADGADYDCEYGCGYCPDYANEVFIEAHGAALEALAQWAQQDGFVGFVELGSLGLWGEWHTSLASGMVSMPSKKVCKRYLDQYLESFSQTHLLSRRNYRITVKEGVGLYNDMVGDADSTQEWLDWQSEGGTFESGDCTLEYKPVESIWLTAPVGGEITSSIEMETILTDGLEETLGLLRQSHVTFLGPNHPKGDNAQLEGSARVLGEMGYRLWISSFQADYQDADGGWDVALTWENSGAAPFYYDWDVVLVAQSVDGSLRCESKVDLALSELAPETSRTTTTFVPGLGSSCDDVSLGVKIVDPLTGRGGVRLSMSADYSDGVTWLAQA